MACMEAAVGGSGLEKVESEADGEREEEEDGHARARRNARGELEEELEP